MQNVTPLDTYEPKLKAVKSEFVLKRLREERSSLMN